MRVFIAVLVLIFSLQSWTKADDIRDFEIEGMSIGDSLLDYFTKNEIKLNPETNTYIYPNSDKYILWNIKSSNLKLNKFDGIQFHYKKNDSKYLIESIDAHIYFFENIRDCYPKKREIYNDIIKLFPNIKVRNENIIHSLNKDSKVEQSSWTFSDRHRLILECYDWSPDMPYGDKLSLSITSEILNDWLNNEAYN